jgi:hypothetical protein
MKCDTERERCVCVFLRKKKYFSFADQRTGHDHLGHDSKYRLLHEYNVNIRM